MAKGKSKKAAAKPAKVVEPDEDEDTDLEELDEDEAEETPTKKGRSDEVAFGASDIARLASEKFGKTYDARAVRTLLRKLAREGKIDREIVPGNKSRYSWTGPDDPEVKMVLKAIKGGAIEAARTDALQKLKDNKAKTKKTATPAATGKKKKAAPVVEEDDDDEDDDDE